MKVDILNYDQRLTKYLLTRLVKKRSKGSGFECVFSKINNVNVNVNVFISSKFLSIVHFYIKSVMYKTTIKVM